MRDVDLMGWSVRLEHGRFAPCMEPDEWIAEVRGGRMVLDVETQLPDGMKVPLVCRSADGPRCDVLLFVTTEDERKALRNVASRMGLVLKDVDGRYSNYVALEGMGGSYRLFVVETEMGALQVDGSATKGILCMFETGARHIIAAGMAFGVNREKQHFGDVLVASHVLPYDFSIVETESDGHLPKIRFDSKANPIPTSPAMLALLQRHIGRSSLMFKVHVGAMLSGSSRIRCRAYRDHLVTKFNKIIMDLGKQDRKRGKAIEDLHVIGGEMEGLGLVATPLVEQHRSWLIVKGISDFADEGHSVDSERARLEASENSIGLVLEALRSEHE